MAREVTIVVLIILAGITLNAVIGEDGIIFQAKDTKNMISNETQYDNEQLAQLQNELRDNQLYSGIGIIPGTDTGGGSEGGENGIGGNQGGSNTGTNTGGAMNSNNPGTLVNTSNNQQTGPIVGGDAQDPIIRVLDGEQVAASFYRSDVTIQIYTEDRTQRIKYILTTTVADINNELYPSGLVKELDIENGGTLTFTKNGEYTLTAYAYDTQGQKSNPVVIWFKRETGSTPDSGITLTASGNEGLKGWYTSNVTIRVLGTDADSARVTYRVQGTVYERGTIGNYNETYEYDTGEITPREIDIANGTNIKVAADGEFTFTAYTYDNIGNRISTSVPLTIKRDATRPVISSFTGEQVIQNNVGKGFQVSVDAIDRASGLTATAYTYRYKLAPVAAYTDDTATGNKNRLYTNLDATRTYDMCVYVTDEAGNRVLSDIISRPALWISSNPLQSEGERINEGKEGSLQYSRSPSIEFSFKGQDSNTVDMSKVEYQVIGTATEIGTIDGTSYIKDQPVNQIKEYLSSNGQDKVNQTITLATDGDWTVKVYTYNKEGKKVTTNAIRIVRDTVAPTITAFEIESNSLTTATAKVSNIEFGVSGQKTGGGYTYSLNDTVQVIKETNNHLYTNLTKTIDYATSLEVLTQDKAGNKSRLTPSKTTYYLKDRVEVGDYVDYNAGVWMVSNGNPTTNLQLGGQTAGHLVSSGIDGKNGWVVTKTENTQITLNTVSGALRLAIVNGNESTTVEKLTQALPENTATNIKISTNTTSYLGEKMWTLKEFGTRNFANYTDANYAKCGDCRRNRYYAGGFADKGTTYSATGSTTYPETVSSGCEDLENWSVTMMDSMCSCGRSRAITFWKPSVVSSGYTNGTYDVRLETTVPATGLCSARKTTQYSTYAGVEVLF